MARTVYVSGDLISAAVANDWLQRSTGDSVLTALSAALPMGTNKITGLGDGVVATDAATKGQVDAHSGAVTGAEHGAVSAATVNMIVRRDAAGRAKVVAPSAEDDIALKSNVTTVQGNLDAKVHATTGHGHTAAAGDGPKIDPATGLTWAPARVATGAYTGDGATASRTITVAFTPKVAHVMCVEKYSDTLLTPGQIYMDATGAEGISSAGISYTTLRKCVADGFTVSGDGAASGNVLNAAYRWFAIG